jgi:Spy/CpxP family protein refolding chaperone
MSHIRSTLAAALLTFGGVAVASAQQPTQPPQAHGAERGARRQGLGRNPLLRGITLSDAEKANLKTVEAQHAAQMKALRQQDKPQMEAMRAARQRGDTAAVRALWEKSKGQREQMQQLMLSQRNEIRAALSPENQAKFDANVAAFQKHAANRAAKGRGRPGFGKSGV